MIKKILVFPHISLVQKCNEVIEFDEIAKQTALDLEDTLKDNLSFGVGLAANQIGSRLRIIAFVDVTNGNVMSIINPVITDYSGDNTEEMMEACLSYPGRKRKIRRAKEITVTGYTSSGNPVNFMAEDFQARIIQHEIDHLSGKCLIGHK